MCVCVPTSCSHKHSEELFIRAQVSPCPSSIINYLQILRKAWGLMRPYLSMTGSWWAKAYKLTTVAVNSTVQPPCLPAPGRLFLNTPPLPLALMFCLLPLPCCLWALEMVTQMSHLWPHTHRSLSLPTSSKSLHHLCPLKESCQGGEIAQRLRALLLS